MPTGCLAKWPVSFTPWVCVAFFLSVDRRQLVLTAFPIPYDWAGVTLSSLSHLKCGNFDAADGIATRQDNPLGWLARFSNG